MTGIELWHIGRIVSGGQTGADRAALDWARQHGVPHGGWCPKGRLATDVPLSAHYQLQETESAGYRQRTRGSDFKVTARPAAVALGALTMAGRNNQDVMAR